MGFKEGLAALRNLASSPPAFAEHMEELAAQARRNDHNGRVVSSVASLSMDYPYSAGEILSLVEKAKATFQAVPASERATQLAELAKTKPYGSWIHDAIGITGDKLDQDTHDAVKAFRAWYCRALAEVCVQQNEDGAACAQLLNSKARPCGVSLPEPRKK